MDKREVVNIVKAYSQLLREHFQIENVYLFGSYAKGKQKEDSDIDVAIVVKRAEGDDDILMDLNYIYQGMTLLNTCQFDYDQDKLNRMIVTRPPDLEYPLTIFGEKGGIETYEYNEKGLLSRVSTDRSQNNVALQELKYDGKNRLLTYAYLPDSQTATLIDSFYYANDKLSHIETYFGLDGDLSFMGRKKYEYNARGEVSKIFNYNFFDETQYWGYEEYSYNDNGLLVKAALIVDDEVAEQIDYLYEAG